MENMMQGISMGKNAYNPSDTEAELGVLTHFQDNLELNRIIRSYRATVHKNM